MRYVVFELHCHSALVPEEQVFTLLMMQVENDEFLVRVKQRTSSSNSGNVSSSNVTCQTYWYRWYISFIFSFMAMLEGAVWNTWGPINESAETAFGFAPSIFLLTVYGRLCNVMVMVTVSSIIPTEASNDLIDVVLFYGYDNLFIPKIITTSQLAITKQKNLSFCFHFIRIFQKRLLIRLPVFPVSDEIELLTNWGPIAIIAAMPFFMWCLDKKGLRMSSVSTAFLIALGTGLRCLPLDPSVLR